MAKFIHDYSKPAAIDKLLLEAHFLLKDSQPSDIRTARELIGSARKLLDEYLASDNLIPDDDE